MTYRTTISEGIETNTSDGLAGKRSDIPDDLDAASPEVDTRVELLYVDSWRYQARLKYESILDDVCHGAGCL